MSKSMATAKPVLAAPPLFIGVKRGQFRQDDPHAEVANKAFAPMRLQVLKEEDYTCQFCGFRSEKFQEIHHFNDNHRINSRENLITACPLCHQVHHIGFAGKQRSGTIVHIPSLSQVDLINLVRTLWIAQMSSDLHIKKYAELLENNIRLNGQSAAREELGFFDASQLGDFLQMLSPRKYLSRYETLRGFHLMPLKQPFAKHIQYWHDHSYAGLEPNSWMELTEKWINKYGYGD